MYSLSYSPDGKYAAYYSIDYGNGADMEPGEAGRIALVQHCLNNNE